MLTERQRKLITDNLNLGFHIAKKLRKRRRKFAALSEDVINSCVYDAMVAASVKYDENRGALGNYLEYFVFVELNEALRYTGVCTLPKAVVKGVKSTPERIKKAVEMVSSETPLDKSRVENPCERLTSKPVDPLESMRWDELMSALTPVQREIIDRRFKRGDKFTAIAEDMGVSRQRLHQKYLHALKTLRGVLGEPC